MDAKTDPTAHQKLRYWARGSTTTEAAVELLIRAFGGRFASDSRPWVIPGNYEQLWVNWDLVPEWTGGLSGGERRVLLFAASLGGGEPVDLSDVAGLDYELQDLLLDAIRHAGGRKVFNLS